MACFMYLYIYNIHVHARTHTHTHTEKNPVAILYRNGQCFVLVRLYSFCVWVCMYAFHVLQFSLFVLFLFL